MSVRRCLCGASAEWIAWRWNGIGTRTEEPFCSRCRAQVEDADWRQGVGARVEYGWRWERIALVEGEAA